MQLHIKKYLSEIGRAGGESRSPAKTLAARKNGKLGGRPKRFREITASQAMQGVLKGEDWKVSFMNFVDGFRRHPDFSLIREDPRELHPDEKMYALLQSIGIQLCSEHGMRPRGWLVKRAFLPEPWFVSGMKSLYASALKESPVSFRKNNIFVLENFLVRV